MGGRNNFAAGYILLLTPLSLPFPTKQLPNATKNTTRIEAARLEIAKELLSYNFTLENLPQISERNLFTLKNAYIDLYDFGGEGIERAHYMAEFDIESLGATIIKQRFGITNQKVNFVPAVSQQNSSQERCNFWQNLVNAARCNPVFVSYLCSRRNP